MYTVGVNVCDVCNFNFKITARMNQSLNPPFAGEGIVKPNCNWKVKMITKARMAPGSCTVEYKQLETCTTNVQCVQLDPSQFCQTLRQKKKVWQSKDSHGAPQLLFENRTCFVWTHCIYIYFVSKL
jgi:hypothetical protein